MTVKTNAHAGYTLAAYDTGMAQPSVYTIPAVSAGPGTGVARFPAKGFGASATLTTGGTDGATLAAGLAGGNWVGYPTAAANFLTATGPTGNTADTLVLTNQVTSTTPCRPAPTATPSTTWPRRATETSPPSAAKDRCAA